MWFDSWSNLGRILAIGPLAYAALVLTLRVSGKRTLSKLNAFDLVVTVALGSTLATIVLSKDVTLAEGVLALVLLVALQFVIAWLSQRSPRFESFVKAEPTLLLHNGRFLTAQMRKQRITREEVLSAIRASGHGSQADVQAVVLETDGSISVITSSASDQIEGVTADIPHQAARTPH